MHGGLFPYRRGKCVLQNIIIKEITGFNGKVDTCKVLVNYASRANSELPIWPSGKPTAPLWDSKVVYG
jgi:hypothetical protein